MAYEELTDEQLIDHLRENRQKRLDLHNDSLAVQTIRSKRYLKDDLRARIGDASPGKAAQLREVLAELEQEYAKD